MSDATGQDIVIVTPVLNDWDSFDQLAREIDALEPLHDKHVQILAVDDGSTSVQTPAPESFSGCLKGVQVLQLHSNQGHQRAIAIGLAYANENLNPRIVIVMDSDGEDRPQDIPILLDQNSAQPDAIIVAKRRERSEGFLFQLFYQIYKLIFSALTGRSISFGNFSLIPKSRLPNIIYSSGIWNNYAATLLKCRIPIVFASSDRGTRFFGESKMNFTSLMIHGISAISVFSDIVIGRIIFFLTFGTILTVLGIICVIIMRLAGGYFVPGYATYVILFLVNLLSVMLFMGFMMILLLLAGRDRAATIPSRMVADMVKSIIPQPEDIDNEDVERASA